MARKLEMFYLCVIVSVLCICKLFNYMKYRSSYVEDYAISQPSPVEWWAVLATMDKTAISKVHPSESVFTEARLGMYGLWDTVLSRNSHGLGPLLERLHYQSNRHQYWHCLFAHRKIEFGFGLVNYFYIQTQPPCGVMPTWDVNPRLETWDTVIYTGGTRIWVTVLLTARHCPQEK